MAADPMMGTTENGGVVVCRNRFGDRADGALGLAVEDSLDIDARRPR
jgi:hypothetical protein